MARHYWTIDQWEFEGPYDYPEPKRVRRSLSWEDEFDEEELKRDFDIRDEDNDDVDE